MWAVRNVNTGRPTRSFRRQLVIGEVDATLIHDVAFRHTDRSKFCGWTGTRACGDRSQPHDYANRRKPRTSDSGVAGSRSRLPPDGGGPRPRRALTTPGTRLLR